VPHRFHSKTAFQARVAETFANPTALARTAEQTPLPEPLSEWLGRLKLLKGVPFEYLVPDEGMLPPESIRFFCVDMNWVDALLDGAFSIGRNLTNEATTPAMHLDAAAIPPARPRIARSATTVRARALGTPPPEVTLQVVSGFLLRSSVVSAYRGIGANVFPEGHTPDDENIQLLPILRFETLGEKSDTLLCLVDGDAYRVDVHEAPEHLHFGINSYKYDAGKVTAEKMIHTFTKTGSKVKLSGDTTPLNLDDSFRTGAPRVVKMASLGRQVAELNNVPSVDAAEMGFEMTQGVGMVSFTKEPS
jgi:hypothetical protein